MKSDKLDFILLIPCYNNLSGLIKSIRSVKYPVDKFEILIVDDGSLLPILKENFDDISSHIKIQIIRIYANQGILNALNTGLKELKTRNDFKYIARLDAGDTCDAERFTKQVRFLDEHPEIGLLGTWCRFTEHVSGKSYLYKTKTKHDDILKEMHFKCSFIHPTVMFRREIIDTIGFYPEDYVHAEDYAYFWLILKKMKGEVLPEILVNIESSKNNISIRNYRKQLLTRMKIVYKYSGNILLMLLGELLLLLRYLMPLNMINFIKLYRSK